jgi:hypothetical protein
MRPACEESQFCDLHIDNSLTLGDTDHRLTTRNAVVFVTVVTLEDRYLVIIMADCIL